MTAIPGTQVAAGIVPFDTNDTYATHSALYGKGGYRTVLTIADRDAISSLRREEGMLVNVISEDTIYQLRGGIANSNWVIFLSGTGDAAIFGSILCTTSDYTYTIANSRIGSGSIINVNLKVPSSTSVIYQCGVTDIVDGSFTVVLSDVPDVLGYSIHWTIQNPV